jgi:hypothetical protein
MHHLCLELQISTDNIPGRCRSWNYSLLLPINFLVRLREMRIKLGNPADLNLNACLGLRELPGIISLTTKI